MQRKGGQRTSDSLSSKKMKIRAGSIYRQTEDKTDEECNVHIKNASDNSLYTGWTNDIKHTPERCIMKEKVLKIYKQDEVPVELVYLEEFDTKQEAMSKEAKIKRLTRKEKLLLIENYQQEQKLNLEH